MKPQGVIGIILIIVAVVALYLGGFSLTHKEQVAKVGPVEVNANKTDSFVIPPIIAYVCLAGGIVLVATGLRK